VGARNSILVGLIAVGIGWAWARLLGRWRRHAGLGGRSHHAAGGLHLCLPALLSAIMLTAVFGAGMVNSIIAIGIFNIPTFARITRASANAVWAREYVLAARACGRAALAHHAAHVLPNILSVLIVQATIQSRWPSWPRPPVLPGPGHAAARALLGRMLSEAQTLMFQAPAGRVARRGDCAGSAGPEPAGRRPARPARRPASFMHVEHA
jgi:peptide/nickel transport system permease protein